MQTQEDNSPIMITLVEKDGFIRKRLSDLLMRERIIGAGSVQEVLESVCRYKNDLMLIISNINEVQKMTTEKMLSRLCQKLGIMPVPILGIYKDGEETIVESVQGYDGKCRLLRFSSNTKFPEHFLNIIKELYPNVNADLESARAMWEKNTIKEPLIDPRTWLKQEGFVNGMAVEQQQESLSDSENDYKAMYYELKKQHDKLLKEVEELKELLNPDK
jgi:hypothetical protein